MMEKIKNKISENSGVVNMAINLAILYLLFTVATGIKDLKQTVGRVEQQTTGTIQPVMGMKPTTDEEFKRMMLDMIISKLQEARDEEIKR
jgi:hypothetical protein